MTEAHKPKPEVQSYTEMTADVYDAIYNHKDYETEAAQIKKLVATRKKSGGNELLDVACGTGLHLPYLIDDFSITGLDLSAQQLAAAKKRLPGIEFIQGDMRTFDLGKQFDAITCLFSSIGYVHPVENMRETLDNFSKHLKPGGVLLVEPWLQPGVFDPNRPPHTDVGELPEKGLKVSRTAHNGLEGNISVMRMEHVVETPQGTREFTEEHRLALYTTEEYKKAFVQAGLSFEQVAEGLSGRGLYIGTKPLAA